MCNAPVGEGGNRTRMEIFSQPLMLIGAHVSPAGGPKNAVARGEERGCQSIQIFNQSPRMWRPSVYSDEAVADFRAALDASEQVDALLIHAIYLVNLATEDSEMREKSLASLIGSLQAGGGRAAGGGRGASGRVAG